MRLTISNKDKLIEILKNFRKSACSNSSIEPELQISPCLICLHKVKCGIKTANAIEDLFTTQLNNKIRINYKEGGFSLIWVDNFLQMYSALEGKVEGKIISKIIEEKAGEK